jgi:hypothetical protein
MKKIASSLALVAAVLAAGPALADGNDASKSNPDKVAQAPIAPPHLFLGVGAGASFTSVDVQEVGVEVHYLSAHAHFDLGVGREVWAGPLGNDRFSIALGYAGAADFNGDEILHSHAFGVTFRKSWIYVTLDGGVAVLSGFQPGDETFVGGHFGVNWGFRMGPVQLGFPISADIFTAPAYTCAATLGFQM